VPLLSPPSMARHAALYGAHARRVAGGVATKRAILLRINGPQRVFTRHYTRTLALRTCTRTAATDIAPRIHSCLGGAGLVGRASIWTGTFARSRMQASELRWWPAVGILRWRDKRRPWQRISSGASLAKPISHSQRPRLGITLSAYRVSGQHKRDISERPWRKQAAQVKNCAGGRAERRYASPLCARLTSA